ncbi:MAG: hypothetical protein K2G03_00135 [Bacilli bacterium]|nr:hypothetical protein [Bacilli bacterium]MDE6140987.1 hypothetical protein [Bacilli bacterium]
MKKISNFTIIFITVFILIGVVAATTTIRINESHEEKLIYAMKSKVEYYAKRCFLENRCADGATINVLYENGYIDELYHPVTKEAIDSNISIEYDGDKVTINW